MIKRELVHIEEQKGGRKRGRKKKSGSFTGIAIAAAALTALGIFYGTGMLRTTSQEESPEELLTVYMEHIANGEYEECYEMLYAAEPEMIGKDAFVQRNSAIYQGIGMENMEVEILAYNKEENTVQYSTAFDTAAGSISFENSAVFVKGEEGWELVWTDSLIFPELEGTDQVRVSTTLAERGEVLDRNGRILAGEGVASSVGIVPGKLEDRSSAVEQIAELLEMDTETIEKKLSAGWVREDSFVPVKTVSKVNKLDLMSVSPDQEVLEEQERQEKLLEIPGVMISDIQVREYPLGEAAAHLVGYVQNVTAEDLEKHAGEGYTESSVIGRSGMESLFEKELKGENGCRIYIVDSQGREKKELASKIVQDGQNIRLTIDADLQADLYEQFQEDKGCFAAVNPYTGEVLALVSTPSYDPNLFILGMTNERWTALNEDEDKPLYNRFRQVWCPGSTFKPIIAAIGLQSGAVDPTEDYGKEGLRWQKDASWGSYYVTTLHELEPETLENALICSDNIYFAKAALKIGAEELESSLLQLGFNEELPFEITMAASQFSNTEHMETEIQVADSGYGQGQMLVNPLHIACLYTAFCHEGNIIKPYLVYQEEARAQYWISEAFTPDAVEQVLEALKKVVNTPEGTGYSARREDVLLAGKTGTAEIKASKEDTEGTELGWFCVFTADEAWEKPVLLVSMVEDVKGRGGSGYVVEKDSQVLDSWFSRH